MESNRLWLLQLDIRAKTVPKRFLERSVHETQVLTWISSRLMAPCFVEAVV